MPYIRWVRLSGIFIYPIKACAGIALARSTVVERGLAYDRRYMLVDGGGRFITQREVNRLCLVQTRLEGERLIVTGPNLPELELPRKLEGAGLELRSYRVWNSAGHGLCHPEGSRWFSEFLNQDVSLLYMPDTDRRAVNPKHARDGDIVSFADGYPLLLISEASLADLNSRSSSPVAMGRFRPNLVISGCEPYAEDSFANVRIGSVAFRGVKRCERCVVTTVDPDTGERGEEPLRTLARYRLEDSNVWLGMNLIPDHYGALRVGDAVFA